MSGTGDEPVSRAVEFHRRALAEPDVRLNEQRKPGTTRGSPWRSRTAKASRISRFAVKSRCACECYNPNLSEDPWAGGVISLHGGAQSRPRPDTVRDNRVAYEMHEGRMQTGRGTAYAGSRLKLSSIQKGTARKASLPAIWGKPAVRNDREDRGNVGIIRSPGSRLDCRGREVTRVPTAIGMCSLRAFHPTRTLGMISICCQS
jgi:hypothetical protein